MTSWPYSRSCRTASIRSGRAGGLAGKVIARPVYTSSQSAKRNYERYLALARSEAQAGNPVGAENYYQHAEHYFRLMSSTQDDSR